MLTQNTVVRHIFNSNELVICFHLSIYRDCRRALTQQCLLIAVSTHASSLIAMCNVLNCRSHRADCCCINIYYITAQSIKCLARVVAVNTHEFPRIAVAMCTIDHAEPTATACNTPSRSHPAVLAESDCGEHTRILAHRLHTNERRIVGHILSTRMIAA